MCGTNRENVLADRHVSGYSVPNNTRAERRKEYREVHVDRRKSAVDVIEHVGLGVRLARERTTSDDRPRRSRPRK
jgi:hypothetical protein